MSTVKQVVSTLQTQRYHILEMYMTECLREMFKFLKNDMISSDELDIITQVLCNSLQWTNQLLIIILFLYRLLCC